MAHDDRELIDGEVDAEAALQVFRDYLENKVDWTPVIPPPGELPAEERWERICGLMLQQAEEAGRAAFGAVATLQARDRDGALADRFRLLEEFFDEEDYATGLALFAEEEGNVLIRMGNEAFAEGALAEAGQIFAFAQLANPLSVEPLIGRLTIEWEERGPERAADLYAAATNVLQNPMLDLFAADCLRAAGRGDEADGLLHRALQQVDEDAEVGAIYGDLREHLTAALPPDRRPNEAG
jgi:tetratricopeptide (TPR) repeat protein